MEKIVGVRWLRSQWTGKVLLQVLVELEKEVYWRDAKVEDLGFVGLPRIYAATRAIGHEHVKET